MIRIKRLVVGEILRRSHKSILDFPKRHKMHLGKLLRFSDQAQVDLSLLKASKRLVSRLAGKLDLYLRIGSNVPFQMREKHILA